MGDGSHNPTLANQATKQVVLFFLGIFFKNSDEGLKLVILLCMSVEYLIKFEIFTLKK